MEIYERIKLRRKEIGLSAETIAEKLGVSPATIYRYENNGIKKFPTDILEPLAKVLHTTPAYLLGIDNNDKGKAKAPTSKSALNEYEEKVLDLLRTIPEDKREDFLKYLQAAINMMK